MTNDYEKFMIIYSTIFICFSYVSSYCNEISEEEKIYVIILFNILGAWAQLIVAEKFFFSFMVQLSSGV